MHAEIHRNLLSERTAKDIAAEPFPHIAVAQALPGDDYQVLQRTFPSMEEILGRRDPSRQNAVARLTAKQVLSHPGTTPEWRRFFEAHVSPGFWNDIVRVFGNTIRASYPDLETRVGRPLEEFIVGVRGEKDKADIRLECQFVVNTPTSLTSAVKTAHVDKRQTLFAGLFYMRDEGDQSEGGDLEFYRWSRSPRFLMHRMILPDDVTAVQRLPYAANTMVCFVNSVNAVHGVTPRLPSVLPRRYINLIVELPFHVFQIRDAGLFARVKNWPQIRQIRHGQSGSRQY